MANQAAGARFCQRKRLGFPREQFANLFFQGDVAFGVNIGAEDSTNLFAALVKPLFLLSTAFRQTQGQVGIMGAKR